MNLLFVLALPIQFLLGLIIGFSLDDKKGVIEAREIVLATLIFALLSAAAILLGPADLPSAGIIGILLAAWMAIWTGIVAGNILRQGLIKKIISSLVVDKVEDMVAVYLRTTTHYGYHGYTIYKRTMQHQQRELQGEIRKVINRLKSLQIDQGIIDKYTLLNDMCAQYVKLAEDIADNKEDKVLQHWLMLGDDLLKISQSTTHLAYKGVSNSLTRMWTPQIIRLYLKSNRVPL